MADAHPPLSRNRDFLLLWSGQVVSVLGWRISFVAYPLLVLGMTGSAAKAGLVGFLNTLPWFVLALPAGAVIDRVDRKRVMIACDVVRALAAASVAVAIWTGELTYAQVLAVALLEGTLGFCVMTAERAALRHVVGREQLPAAVARNEAREQAAFVVGPPLGGALFGIGRALPFVADAVSYLVSLATLLLIRTPFQERRAPAGTSLRSEIREGMAWLWGHHFLRSCALLVAGSNLVVTALMLVVVVVAERDGASPAAIGAMLALVGLGGVAGALAAAAAQRRLSARTVIVGANWVAAVLVPLLAFAPGPVALGVVLGLISFVGPIWNAVVVGYRVAIVPDELQGRVQGVAAAIAMSGVPLGPLLAGIGVEKAGATATILALAAGTLALAVAGSLNRSLRRPPAFATASRPAPAEL